MVHINIDDSYIKSKCQIFTPKEQIIQMLNEAGYSDDVIGKKVLENSCGDGRILEQIVYRYMESSHKKKLSSEDIKKGLENDIFAYDLDPKMVRKCKYKLNKIAKQHGILGIKWNISCKDFLESKTGILFDYIIGNPPYIAYHDLEKGVRNYVRENYETCKKGKFDYSYAFIEKSYNSLAKGGKLTYIIPSNIFKNVFAKELRELIKMDIISIIDFPDERIFGKVLVSPAIITVEKSIDSKILFYTCSEYEIQINKENLGDKWIFDNNIGRIGFRVGDYFKVSSTVATLLNKAFVLKNVDCKNGYYTVAQYKIEETVVRRAASPKNKKYDKNTEYIIFPYYYDDEGVLCRYSRDDFAVQFPFAAEYLNTFLEELEGRDSDKAAEWFEYGRSQALKNMNQSKIMISSIISDCTKAYLLDADEIPYSGLYIIPKGEKSLEALLIVLNSDNFKRYISKVGVCVSGTSKRINPSDIENFIVEE